MVHEEHVDLIRKGIRQKGGIWADLGSGEGAFTLALRDLAGKEVEIYSVDQDKVRLQLQKEIFNVQFPDTKIHYLPKDFTKSLDLPQLDGIVMANSLHYIEDHPAFLTAIQKYLKPKGQLILVEYSIDTGNQWVPYPLSFPTFERVAKEVSFTDVQLLKKIPSSYWGEMYSAEATLG